MSAPASRDAPVARRATIRAIVVLVLCVLAAGAGLVADRTDGAAAVVAPEPVAQDPARAGVWYCAATAGQDAATLTVAAVGDEPSTVTVVRYEESGPTPGRPVTIAPGGSTEVELAAGAADTPVAVRWTGGPASATWRSEGADAVAAPCEAGPAERWHFAGFDTAGGNRSVIHLFNPFTVDAVARVTFATQEGPVSLVLTDNVLVEAGGYTAVDLGEFQPEQQDLGATVEVESGRLVASGEVVFSPRDSDADLRGRTLVSGTPAPATSWAWGYAGVDDEASSWLSIVNPGEQEAAVQVQVSDPVADSPLTGEVAIPPGAVVRVDLTGTSEARWFGVAVTSTNEVPVVVSRLTGISTVNGRHGAAASLGTAQGTRTALVGGGTEDRSGYVGLYNPSGEPVTASVAVGGQSPSGWDAIELPANALAVLELAEVAANVPSVPVVVDANEPIVAELRSTSPGDELRLWSLTGVPEAVWTGPVTRPSVRRDPSLVTQPVAPEPTAQPAPDPAAPPRGEDPEVREPGEEVPTRQPGGGEELVRGAG